MEAGMDDYVPKPVTLRTRTEAVHKWTAVPVEN